MEEACEASAVQVGCGGLRLKDCGGGLRSLCGAGGLWRPQVRESVQLERRSPPTCVQKGGEVKDSLETNYFCAVTPREINML